MKKLLNALFVFSIVPSLLFAGRLPSPNEQVSLTDEHLPTNELQRIMDHAHSRGKPHPKNAQARVLRFSTSLGPLSSPSQMVTLSVPTKVTVTVEKPEIPGIVTAIRSLRVKLEQGNGRAAKVLRVSVKPDYGRFCGTPPVPPPTLRSAIITNVSISAALARALPKAVVPINLKIFFRPVLQTALRAALATARRT